MLARYPRQLSGGQRQRVAMGRAIVRDPKVFLFDEPLSNLDAKLRVQVRGEIKDLQRRLNTTTLYVTHDQVEAMTMGDKIVVLNGGKVEQTGAPLDLYDRPANMFVAGFLGSPAMNFVEGAIEIGHDARLRLDGLAAPLARAPAAWNARPVIYGIRPEDIRLDPAAGVAATVVAVEPTGYETHVLMRLGQKEIVAIMRERAAFAARDEIKISLASPIAHFFDPATGLRLAKSRKRITRFRRSVAGAAIKSDGGRCFMVRSVSWRDCALLSLATMATSSASAQGLRINVGAERRCDSARLSETSS